MENDAKPKHPGGRPLKFKSEEQLANAIADYFTWCDDKGELPTVTGLAYHLDTTRRTLIDYQETEEFSHTIKRAKARIESRLESAALGGKANPAVAIFSLKNNYGWQDKREVENSGEQKLTVEVVNYADNPTPNV